MAAKRFSEFDAVLNPSGSEEIVGVKDGQNVKVRLDTVKSLVTKTDVGLGNVDNTTDLNKPVSTAQQSALNSKANVGHDHAVTDVTGLQSVLDSKASTVHAHNVADVTGLQGALDGKADHNHTHTTAELPEVQADLNNKANIVHAHNLSDITGLTAELNGKAAVVHQHTAMDIADLDAHIQEALQDAGITAGDVSVDNIEW